MRKFTRKLVAAATACSMVFTMTGMIMKSSAKTVSAVSASSKLVWSDEFNGSSLNTSKWGYETGTGSWGWGNNEQQYYTDRRDNLYVSDGVLHIKAKRENYGGMNYTSARINTSGKFTFTYGYVEARMALPASSGIWPAFWMLGANIGSVGWPACGEIDIMEAVNAEYKTYATCHWNANGHAQYGKSTGNFDITQYHTYALAWDSNNIRMFVDGGQIYEMYIGNNSGDTDEFHRPFYLLLNVAVGGNWPGFSIDEGALPQEMKVDYVRVYQDNPSFSSSSSDNVDSGNTNQNQNNNNNNNNNNNGGANSGNVQTPASGMGMEAAGNNAATAYVNDSSWTDIHYSVNNGGQQNVRMTQNGTKATYTIQGLNAGDTVKYWFTYCNTSGYVQDTQSYTYTHQAGGASSSGSQSGGGNNAGSSSTNTASGDVYIYQDINYGGRSASLGLGSYNLASLQAKGFYNDDLSSIKVPWGYKVTLYADDNFSGASRVITADTSWIGNDWNDRVSSIRVEQAQYKIVNRNSGLCLDVSSGSTDNGANIQQWTDNGTNAQKWEVHFNASDSTYVLVNVGSRKAMDMDAWSKDNGGNAIQWDNNNTDNQRWFITEVDNGYSFLINKNSNKALDAADWATWDGGNVHQWDYQAQANQQWKFIQVN